MAITGLALVSCAMQKSKSAGFVNEGIEGYVYKTSGNQMPMKGKPVQHTGKGIACEVLIYEATTMQQVQGNIPLFTEIKTRLVKKVASDSSGHYQVALPVGSYSVFVKDRDLFFAAETNGQGVLNPVDVTDGKVTRRNITVNTGAVY